jgi:hypothetical protein
MYCAFLRTNLSVGKSKSLIPVVMECRPPLQQISAISEPGWPVVSNRREHHTNLTIGAPSKNWCDDIKTGKYSYRTPVSPAAYAKYLFRPGSP